MGLTLEIQDTRSSPMKKPSEPGTESSSSLPEWVVGSESGRQLFEKSFSITQTSATTDPDRFWPEGALTSDRIEINREIELLAASARAEKIDVFTTLLNSMTWDQRPLEDFLQGARLCLKFGLHQLANQIVMKGLQTYPNHPELDEVAKLLGPSRVIQSRLQPDLNAVANMQWLRQHSREYHGKFVAIKNGELLGVGSSYRELIEKVGAVKGKGILLTQVF